MAEWETTTGGVRLGGETVQPGADGHVSIGDVARQYGPAVGDNSLFSIKAQVPQVPTGADITARIQGIRPNFMEQVGMQVKEGHNFVQARPGVCIDENNATVSGGVTNNASWGADKDGTSVHIGTIGSGPGGC